MSEEQEEEPGLTKAIASVTFWFVMAIVMVTMMVSTILKVLGTAGL